MSASTRLFVVSDLHLGPGGGLDIFFAADALANFVDHVNQVSGPVELVLLGDALDFLQFEEALAFTEAEALRKITAILAHNGVVWDALAALLGRADATLRWFIGNHDLELLFPAVRAAIVARLGDPPAGRLVWALDGEARRVPIPGGGEIHLAHGNKGDSWNEVDYEAAAAVAAAGGDAAFAYPLGSRLVAQILNPLKKTLPHLDLLKPEVEVAVPLAIAAAPDEAIPHLATFLGLQGAVSAQRWRSRLRPRMSALQFGPADPEAPAPPPEAGALLGRALLGAEAAGAEDPALLELASLLAGASAPYRPGGPLVFGVADTLGLGLLAERAARAALAEDASFLVEQPDSCRALAEGSHRQGAALVVAGHTHLARACSLPGGHYLNCGTWADLMRLPRGLSEAETTALIAALPRHLADPARAPWTLRPFRRLTYVDIAIYKDPAHPYTADLRQWPEAGAVTLAALP